MENITREQYQKIVKAQKALIALDKELEQTKYRREISQLSVEFMHFTTTVLLENIDHMYES